MINNMAYKISIKRNKKDKILIKYNKISVKITILMKFALLGLCYNTINSKYKYKILSIYTINLTNLSKYKYNIHNNISLLVLYKYKIQYIDINKLITPAKAIHLARSININSFKLYYISSIFNYYI